MIIQVFGTPCTGKTSFIKDWILHNPTYSYYDVAMHRDVGADFLNAENIILKKIINEKRKYIIIESATGFHDIKSFNIKLSCDLDLLEKNHIKRRIPFTNEQLDYYSLLHTIEIVPDLTINITETTTFKDISNKIYDYMRKSVGII